jgi:hypothetical protein
MPLPSYRDRAVLGNRIGETAEQRESACHRAAHRDFLLKDDSQSRFLQRKGQAMLLAQEGLDVVGHAIQAPVIWLWVISAGYLMSLLRYRLVRGLWSWWREYGLDPQDVPDDPTLVEEV